MLTPTFLDELRARTTLSVLIGRSVKLQRAGREWKACCPFHQEKSPSFYVNDEKGFWNCFGCAAHGDAIKWLTDTRGLPFMDAVKDLAQAAGLDMPAPDPAARARADRASGLAGLSEAAAGWFRRQLDGIEGAASRAYLDARGIGAEARATFGLGYAPDGRNRLRPGLDGADEAQLVEAGLLIKPEGDGPAYDRFRGRLMIPIRDARGRTIAFGGRIIGEGEPKYLNSPETPLFDKGRTLFNLDRAGPIGRKSGRLLVVEGYLDVIALDQAGIGEAVAPLGTALTEAQMALLWRVSDVPIICFDGDVAGRGAALRAAVRALPGLQPGKSLAFVTLPPGKDPDDIVREGGSAAMQQLLNRPAQLADVLWEAEMGRAQLHMPEGRAALREALMAAAETIAHPLVRAEYRREFGERCYQLGRTRMGRPRLCSASIVQQEPAVRTLLAELDRHPEAVAAHIEGLAALPIATDQLSAYRDRMIAAVLQQPPASPKEPRVIQATGALIETLTLQAELAALDAMVLEVFGHASDDTYLNLERGRAVIRSRLLSLREVVLTSEMDRG